MLEEELSINKGLVVDRDAQILQLNQAQTSYLQNEPCLASTTEIRASKLRWLVQEGIPSFVCALLNSTDFGDVNAAVQTTAIQLGLHRACVEMKEKYVDVL